jgi:hypothetical protein
MGSAISFDTFFFFFRLCYKERKKEEKGRLLSLRSARAPFCPQLEKKKEDEKKKKKEHDEGSKNERWLADILDQNLTGIRSR